jgi:hypothetical protein
MRVLGIMAVVVLSVATSIAQPNTLPITVATGTGTGGTNVMGGISGYINEIQVSCSDGASTGTVYIAYVPKDGITAAVNIATNAVAASKIWRPVVDYTDTAGAALTSDEPGKYLIVGESLRMIVLGSPTNVTWTATIKLDDGR